MPGLFDLPATQDVPDPGASSNPYLLALGQLLGGIGRTAYNAATLPGDVYQGNVQVGTPQYNQRAFDLASMMVGTPGGAGGLGSGIRAYHGSPYDFDRFDMSKIGTGEGAQAYGHGLYFAENPETGEAYKDATSRIPRYLNTGDQTIDLTREYRPFAEQTPEERAAGLVRRFGSIGKNASDSLDAAINEASKSRNPSITSMMPVLQSWKEKGATFSPGKMYEVNINADPSHFLDWDKPLSEQPHVSPDIVNKVSDMLDRDPRGITGADAVNALSRYADQAAATHQLSSAGIPGIKYLDQGSRAGGKGTSNYVVFDDNLISILRKYGLVPGAAIPPTIGGMMGLRPVAASLWRATPMELWPSSPAPAQSSTSSTIRR